MQYSRTSIGVLLSGTIVFLGGTPGAANIDLMDAPLAIKADVLHRDLISESHEYCLAIAVYFEGGSTGETEVGQRHIARVVVERAKANKPKWGGADICDVVFYRRAGVCQFSFACLPTRRRTPRGGTAWDYSRTIARDELSGRSRVTERSIRYYMNAALTPDRNACRFRKEFVPVLNAGRHQFFREPTGSERAQIAKAEYTECIRHAQAAKAKKKRSAKARGKKRRIGAKVHSKQKRVAAKARNKSKKAKHARR